MDSDLASFFEDLSQSNNISEIKPPLPPSENQFLLIEKQKFKLFSFFCVQIWFYFLLYVLSKEYKGNGQSFATNLEAPKMHWVF